MRAQMRPRAPKKHPKGGQETAQRHPRESKSSPRASKLRRRQAQEAPKPLQKRAWGLPKQAWGMILVRSFSQKAPTAIFCYFWRRTPKPLNSRWHGGGHSFCEVLAHLCHHASRAKKPRKMWPNRPTYSQLGLKNQGWSVPSREKNDPKARQIQQDAKNAPKKRLRPKKEAK